MTKALLLLPLIFFSFQQVLLAQSPRLIKEEVYEWDRAEELWQSLSTTDYFYLDAFGSYEKKHYEYRHMLSDIPFLEHKLIIEKNALNLETKEQKTTYEYDYFSGALEEISRVKTSRIFNNTHQLSSIENTFHLLDFQEIELSMTHANRETYSYDENDCLKSQLYEVGNTSGNQVEGWRNSSTFTRSNNSDCELLEKIDYSYFGNLLIPKTKSIRQYSTNGDTIKTLHTTEYWDTTQNIWILTYKNKFLEVYNEANQIIYLEIGENEFNSYREYYTYDELGRLSEKRRENDLDYRYGGTINGNEVYSYDGNKTESIDSIFAYYDDDFLGTVQIVTIIDAHGNLLNREETRKYFVPNDNGQEYFSETFVRLCDGTPMEHTKIIFRSRPSDFINIKRKTIYTYTGIPPCDPAWDEDTNIHVFPNPSTGLLNIESPFLTKASARISVFNTLGQQLFETTYNGQEGWYTLNLPGLPLGSYHLMIEAEGERCSQSIVIGQ